jgi:diguanylate cyclase (GGDEF)-like protein
MSDLELQAVKAEKTKQALDALLSFVSQVNHSDSISDATWHLAHHTIKSLDLVDCVVYLYDPSSQRLVQKAAYGPKNPKKRQVKNAMKLRVGEGIVGNSAANCKSIMVNDTRLSDEYVVDDKERLSELAVPIHYHQKLIGVIDSEHPEANFFTDFHRRYLEILASVLASKIIFNSTIKELNTSYQSLQQSKTLSDTFLLISELSYQSASAEDFYLGLHKIIEKQVHTSSFFVVSFDTQNKEYSCPYWHDESRGGEFDASIDHANMSNTLIAEVITNQVPRLARADELEHRIKTGKLINRGPKVFSWLAVPFKISNSLEGAIALQSYDSDILFSDSDKEFLTFLAQHVSVVIDQKNKDNELQYQALHDSVTGLANRTLFLDRLEHAFMRSTRAAHPDLAVLFIDFDDFKAINDNFGHQTGDQVLATAAERMQAQLRSSDTLARIGGDEFAILLEDLESESMVISVSNRILQVMNTPIHTADEPVLASVSIGISFRDEKVSVFEDMLKNADHAMYHAKRRGKNNFQLYEERIHQSILEERSLLHELKTALKEGQLFFYYQPIVSLEHNCVAGFEALMRWNHPRKGLISPDEFIHIAEQYDLISEIDSQLLTNVAEQVVRINGPELLPIYVSINISSQRFVDSKLITEIASTIHKYQLPKNSIIVEVTEHVLMKNIAKARNLFHQLKLLGVKISLDDFGTGYSSLSYINQLPFDVIKIDRSFVSHIDDNHREHPVISVIVALAKTLKIELVAEGIETSQQLEVLSELKCDFGQGFYLAEPMPASEVVCFIKNQHKRLPQKTTQQATKKIS